MYTTNYNFLNTLHQNFQDLNLEVSFHTYSLFPFCSIWRHLSFCYAFINWTYHAIVTWEIWQSKPSTLTVACFAPNSPLVWADDAKTEFDWEEHLGIRFSRPKPESCTKGFGTLHDGDPKKNGGDDAKVVHCSASWSYCKNKRSIH